MFNNKRIKQLEDKVSELEFRLNHPPKYKVGDKVGNHVVTDVKLLKPEFCLGYAISGMEWRYETFNLKTKEKSRIL